MIAYNNDPTVHKAFSRLFGDPDAVAEKDLPRVRALSGGRLEIDGVIFAKRDGRDSGYSAPWAELTGGDAD